jgi:hypothetical protein
LRLGLASYVFRSDTSVLGEGRNGRGRWSCHAPEPVTRKLPARIPNIGTLLHIRYSSGTLAVTSHIHRRTSSSVSRSGECSSNRGGFFFFKNLEKQKPRRHHTAPHVSQTHVPANAAGPGTTTIPKLTRRHHTKTHTKTQTRAETDRTEHPPTEPAERSTSSRDVFTALPPRLHTNTPTESIANYCRVSTGWTASVPRALLRARTCTQLYRHSERLAHFAVVVANVSACVPNATCLASTYVCHQCSTTRSHRGTCTLERSMASCRSLGHRPWNYSGQIFSPP